MLKYVLIFSLTFAFFACSDKKDENTKSETVETNKTEDALDELLNLGENEMLVATIQTNMGAMELELHAQKAPKTVKNFCGLAQRNYYDGVIFHRIIDGFMIQGGDPTGTGRGGESYYGGVFENEVRPDLSHNDVGVLSMANAGPNTNGSQFFITLKPQPRLDGGYSVFGKLISGGEVLQAIGKVKTNQMDKPLEDVVMEKVTVEKRAK